MPIPVIEPERASGPAPTMEERHEAAANTNMDELFSEEADINPPAEDFVKEGEATRNEGQGAQPDSERVVQPKEPQIRPPRILPAIPPAEPEEAQEEETQGEPVIADEDETTTVEDEAKPQNDAAIDQLAEALRRAFPERQQEEQKSTQLSPEEYSRIMNVYTPPDDLWDRLSNPETRAVALKEFKDGIMKEASTMAFYLADGKAKELQSELQVLRQQTSKMTVTEQRASFFKAYPSLNNKNFLPVLNAVAQQLKGEGFKPADHVTAFKTLAERTEKILKTVNPSFKLNGSTTNKPSTTVPKPTVTKAAGATGGATSKTNPKVPVGPAGVEIFD